MPAGTKTCPHCDAPLKPRLQDRPRYGAVALALFGAAALVTLAWIWVLTVWSPVHILPRGPYGFAICAVVYLGPGLVVAFVAASLPKVRTLRCHTCGWSGRADGRMPPAI